MKANATEDDPWALEWSRTHSAGFGPYHVERVVPGVETVLVTNPNWTGHKPHFDRVILKAVPESSARLALLKAGQIDIAWGLNERELQQVEGDENLQVVRAIANKQLYVGLGVDKPPFDNVKVRQAMAWATPYEDIIEKVYYGHARRMRSTVPDIYAGFESTYHYEYDLEKAKALLDEAGFPDGFDVKLSYNASQKEAEEMAILVKSSWEQIGVSVALQAMPVAVFTEQQYGKKAFAGLRRERAVAVERRSGLFELGLSRQRAGQLHQRHQLQQPALQRSARAGDAHDGFAGARGHHQRAPADRGGRGAVDPGGVVRLDDRRQEGSEGLPVDAG